MPYRDVRTIPTTLLALVKPERSMAVRYRPIHTAGIRLLHRSLLKNAPFSAAEYRDVLSMGEANVMRNEWGWKARDLWDVQGFLWTTSDAQAESTTDDDDLTPPINLILYGPAGTGKTYATATKAVTLCDGVVPGDREAVMERYRELVASYSVSTASCGAPKPISANGARVERGPAPGRFRRLHHRCTMMLRRFSGGMKQTSTMFGGAHFRCT
jgi:hypothetical protein